MNSAPRVLEQQNLLGGLDLLAVPGKGKGKRGRKVHVPGPAGFAKALALVVEHGKKQARELGTTSLSRCPRCGHEGPTLQDFGTRVIRGERRPQSWCRACRAHALPPLSSPAQASARELKASRPVPPAPVAASADGWLFPPETLGPKPAASTKRSRARAH